MCSTSKALGHFHLPNWCFSVAWKVVQQSARFQSNIWLILIAKWQNTASISCLMQISRKGFFFQEHTHIWKIAQTMSLAWSGTHWRALECIFDPTRATRLCDHSGVITILPSTHTLLVCLTWVLPRCTLGNLRVLKVICAPACDERELIRAADVCLHADFGVRQAAVTLCAVNRRERICNRFCPLFPYFCGHTFQHILFCFPNVRLPVFLSHFLSTQLQMWFQNQSLWKSRSLIYVSRELEGISIQQ